MRYLWVVIVLSISACAQNAYGPDFLNLHCTAPDPLAQTLFNIQPRPGLVPDRSANGNVVFYCDAVTGTLKGSFNGSAYTSIAPTGAAGSNTQLQINNAGLFGAISNVAAGSVLASNGASSTPIFQAKALFDLRDFSGVDCTGATDSSTTYATLFAAQKEYRFPAGSAGCNIKLAATVEPASTGSWSHHGSAGSGGFGSGSLITCSMSAIPCLWFDRQRDADFGQFSVSVGSASVGLQISQLTATSGQISTNNHWHDMYFNNIGSGESGILVGPTGDSTSNNELQIFSNIGMVSGGSQIGTGFNTNQVMPNCRSMALNDVSTNNFSTGYTFGCSTFHMIGGLQEANTLDFGGNSSTGTLGGGFIAATHSESSKQWLSNWGTSTPFGFLFNRNEMNNPDLTKFQWDISTAAGTFISIGNHWKANANITKMVNLPTAGADWVSIGDQMPNSTTANLTDITHIVGQTITLETANRLHSSIAVTNGFNGKLGTDLNDSSGLYLSANDWADSGANGSFYTSPGLNIAALFQSNAGARVFLPWRFIVTGTPSGGVNPPANLVLKIDNDPVTGTTPADTGALGMDFTGGVKNGGILALPATSAVSYATSTNCAAVGTAANPSVASCTAAVAGSFSCATNASGGTCTVNTTAVTANSEIFLTQRADTTTGTRLGVTCNTTLSTVITQVTAITAGTSFTINLGTIAANPECFSYHIIN